MAPVTSVAPNTRGRSHTKYGCVLLGHITIGWGQGERQSRLDNNTDLSSLRRVEPRRERDLARKSDSCFYSTTRVLEICHEAHLGIVKSKQPLRSKVWFPGIDKKMEAKISG